MTTLVEQKLIEFGHFSGEVVHFEVSNPDDSQG